MQRRLANINNFRFGELLFLTCDFCRNNFAVDGKRNEDSFSVVSRDAFAAKSDVVDVKIDGAHRQS